MMCFTGILPPCADWITALAVAGIDIRELLAGAAAMREAIGAGSDELERSQVEELYPKFRGRFWTGRDASNNQRFGPMFFPYLEHAANATRLWAISEELVGQAFP